LGLFLNTGAEAGAPAYLSERFSEAPLVVRALKISQLTDGGMPPTYDSMH
jgi:hypothetical protein